MEVPEAPRLRATRKRALDVIAEVGLTPDQNGERNSNDG